MYQQRILGKSLQTIETCNSVSVIASDKTGTLTQNKMTVTHTLWDTYGEYKTLRCEEEEGLLVGAVSNIHHGAVRVAPVVAERLSNRIANQRNNNSDTANEVKNEVFRDLLLGAALCNDAERQLVQDAQVGEDTSKMNSELHLDGGAVDIALYNLCVYQCHMELMKYAA